MTTAPPPARYHARSAALVGALVAVGAVALTVWAGPSVVQEVRDQVAERRWPAQRATVESVAAAVRLPERYTPMPCPGSAVRDASTCWSAPGEVDDTVADDLAAALAGAGVADVRRSVVDLPRQGVVDADAVGVVEGRAVMLTAWRDRVAAPDGDGTVPTGDTLVSLVVDLTPP